MKRMCFFCDRSDLLDDERFEYPEELFLKLDRKRFAVCALCGDSIRSRMTELGFGKTTDATDIGFQVVVLEKLLHLLQYKMKRVRHGLPFYWKRDPKFHVMLTHGRRDWRRWEGFLGRPRRGEWKRKFSINWIEGRYRLA